MPNFESEFYREVPSSIPSLMHSMLECLHRKNIKAIVAGGCVRDWRLRRRHKDIDLFAPLKSDSITQAIGFGFSKKGEPPGKTKYSTTLTVLERLFGDQTFQLILVPLERYDLLSIEQYVDKTFDFDINKGIIKLVDGNLKIYDEPVVREINDTTLTFRFLDLEGLPDKKFRVNRIPERSARFQDLLPNFRIKIV